MGHIGCFLKWWYPTTMGFPTKNDHFEVFWGYHHLRKHPYRVKTQRTNYNYSLGCFNISKVATSELINPIKICSFQLIWPKKSHKKKQYKYRGDKKNQWIYNRCAYHPIPSQPGGLSHLRWCHRPRPQQDGTHRWHSEPFDAAVVGHPWIPGR